MEDPGMQADDEEGISPGFPKRGSIPADYESDKKISIAHIHNTDESENEDQTLEEGKSEEDEIDHQAELEKQIRAAAVKNINLPPPLELIAKSTYKEEEPIKTGAPISFVSLA